MPDPASASADRQRIDKWLWFARLAKSRTQAQKVAVSGKVRVEKIASASHPVKVGDTLTIGMEAGVRVLRVLAAGTRRGPATEARLLFEDLALPVAREAVTQNTADAGGRPSKRDRRSLTALKRGGANDFPDRQD